MSTWDGRLVGWTGWDRLCPARSVWRISKLVVLSGVTSQSGSTVATRVEPA